MKAVLIVAASLYSVAAFGQTLHVLAVSDNTKGNNIRVGVNNNLRNLHETAEKIASITDMKMNFVSVEGDLNFKCSSVEEEINKLVIRQDEDVVIFYYSGHGGHPSATSNKDAPSSPFPWLYCDGQLKPIGPNQEEFTRKIESKKPRLVISVADACNSAVPGQFPKVAKGVPEDLVRDMYLRFKGTILVSSSISDQFSFYYDSGGMFSARFLPLLTDVPTSEISKSADVWDAVLKEAKKTIKVPENDTGQLEQQPQAMSDLVFLGTQ